MNQHDIDLGVAKPQDKDAELAKLREEVAALKAKRDNDEASAFGRLRAEAELRKQKEQEAAELKRQLAEIQAKNAKSVLTPEQIEALGTTGAEGVEKMIEAKLAAVAPASPAGQVDFTPILARIEAMERAQQATSQRASYNASLVAWASQNGTPSLFARLAPGGDLSAKWAAFAQQNPSAVAAYENGDTEATKAYVKLFLYENPGIIQQTPTPSAAGGFAPPADPNQYSPATWLTETNALDAKLSAGQITKAEYDKGYADANAKLAAFHAQ